jgi:hypothetical protein
VVEVADGCLAMLLAYSQHFTHAAAGDLIHSGMLPGPLPCTHKAHNKTHRCCATLAMCTFMFVSQCALLPSQVTSQLSPESLC